MYFGKQLLRTRKSLYLNERQLAVLFGVSRSYICLMESGRRLPSKKLLKRMALILNISNKTIIDWYIRDVREQIREVL